MKAHNMHLCSAERLSRTVCHDRQLVELLRFRSHSAGFPENAVMSPENLRMRVWL